ncbi:MAG: ATP-binding protein [Gammaproteobacteria bacterium]|nr:ATP-binding protein [Gammaproteobacteria bacterium]
MNICPFTLGLHFDDPACFVGRENELRFLSHRLGGVQPASVNIHGPRRCGKSWLLQQFYHTWQERVEGPARYLSAYLDCKDEVADEAAFCQITIHALERAAAGQGLEAPVLTRGDWDADSLEAALRAWQNDTGLIPLLCLDDIDRLLTKGEEKISRDFQVRLRALSNHGCLLLIGASREPLSGYPQQGRDSPLFNNAHSLALGDFDEDEAKALLRLPARLANGLRPDLSEEAQRLGLRWGGCNPWRLQAAAVALWEAENRGRAPTAAKNDFEQQVLALEHNRPPSWWSPRGLFGLVATLGETQTDTGARSRLRHFILGASLLGKVMRIALVGLVVFGLWLFNVPVENLPQRVRDVLGWLK